MTKRILWVDSTLLTTESYRDKVVATYPETTIETIGTAYGAIRKIAAHYDTLVLNPQFLNLGFDPDGCISVPDVLETDPLGSGFYFYDRLRTSINARTPLVVVTVRPTKRVGSLKRIVKKLSDHPRFAILDLMDVPPSQFVERCRDYFR